jgi:hypothetical protein
VRTGLRDESAGRGEPALVPAYGVFDQFGGKVVALDFADGTQRKRLGGHHFSIQGQTTMVKPPTRATFADPPVRAAFASWTMPSELAPLPGSVRREACVLVAGGTQ